MIQVFVRMRGRHGDADARRRRFHHAGHAAEFIGNGRCRFLIVAGGHAVHQTFLNDFLQKQQFVQISRFGNVRNLQKQNGRFGCGRDQQDVFQCHVTQLRQFVMQIGHIVLQGLKCGFLVGLQQLQGLNGRRGGKGGRRGGKTIPRPRQSLMLHHLVAAHGNATNGTHAIFQGNGGNFHIVHQGTIVKLVHSPTRLAQATKRIGLVQNQSITKFVLELNQFLEWHNRPRLLVQSLHDQESSLRIERPLHLLIVRLNLRQQAP
mmetsp:Transcript_4249/g.8911  ORF Transcript_4249/g.8911 Transcript_4249/m.8911 type:complete len:262 (+) Transcript_4249:167-952(+)